MKNSPTKPASRPAFPANSLALLIWHILDLIMFSYRKRDNEYLEELLQWSKRAHREVVGYRHGMGHAGRLSAIDDGLDELRKAMEGNGDVR